jgi:hypothetical protein
LWNLLALVLVTSFPDAVSNFRMSNRFGVVMELNAVPSIVNEVASASTGDEPVYVMTTVVVAITA